MGIINRLLLLVYALCVSVSVLFLAGVFLHLIPEGMWQNELRYAVARPESLAVLAVVFLLGVHLMVAALSSGGKKDRREASGELVLSESGQGKVKVAVTAIRELSERSALAVTGVRDVKAKVEKQKEGSPISIALQLVLIQGASAPDVSGQAAQAVRRELAAALKLPDVPVNVLVSDISNAPVEQKRVV